MIEVVFVCAVVLCVFIYLLVEDRYIDRQIRLDKESRDKLASELHDEIENRAKRRAQKEFSKKLHQK